MPDIAVLAIGDELLNGSLAETNSMQIARILGRGGYRLVETRSVPDSVAAISATIREMSKRFDVIIITGGLGPTRDDLTAESLADAFSLPLELDRQAMEMISDFFSRTGRTIHQLNEKSALMPRGAVPLVNPCGTAPGIRLEASGCTLFAFPGVPSEMAALVESEVLPVLKDKFGTTYLEPERVLTLFGIPEPQVEELLSHTDLPASVEIAFAVEMALVHLKLRSAGKTAGDNLDRAEAMIREQLQRHIVAQGGETIAERTAALLIASGRTVSLAESCTGGLISKLLTDPPGASAYLERSAVTYADSAKQDWLKVPAPVLEQQGAVSDETARAMAEGIRQAAGSDIGIAVTGIAGPDGGSDEKPVGTVFIALSAAGQTEVVRHRFPGSREVVRTRTAYTALAMIQQHLLDAGQGHDG